VRPDRDHQPRPPDRQRADPRRWSAWRRRKRWRSRSTATSPPRPAPSCFDKIELKGERTLAITYRKDRVNAGEVLAALQRDGLGIVDVSTREADLEDVFLNLTRGANANG
jgi:hypothetical protein